MSALSIVQTVWTLVVLLNALVTVINTWQALNGINRPSSTLAAMLGWCMCLYAILVEVLIA